MQLGADRSMASSGSLQFGGSVPKEVNAAMPRYCTTVLMALGVLGLIFTAPVRADDAADMHREISKLRGELDALSKQDSADIETAVENYLAESDSWRSAEGEDKMSKLTMGAWFTAVNQNTVGSDPQNVSTVNGNVAVLFNFNVTEGLDIFTDLFAGTEGTLPGLFPLDSGGFGPPSTLAGQFDGIGINGSVPVRPSGGVQILQAGIRTAYPVGSVKLHWEMGLIDPRERFLQNTFMRSENNQFVHNQFDDESAISWATRADSSETFGDTGAPTILGLYGWVPFGAEDAFTFRYGWFNTPGEFFDRGQFYLEFSWRGKVSGREMNFVVMYAYDGFSDKGGGGEADSQWGVSWDWLATDKAGVFIRIAGNNKDVNPVEASAAFGFVWTGIGNRKDDQFGLAIGYIKANTDFDPLLPEDTEWTLELYYKFMVADGKMQITPNIIYVKDPGGGGLAWQDEVLWILGVRFHVPF